MSSYGELIAALKILKSVKEKRHAIKALAHHCANRAFQLRIVHAGGWKDAILPLIISLDDECRKYASLAISNLSINPGTFPLLMQEEVVRHLAPVLYEEVSEVTVYVLIALGNFATSNLFWPILHELNILNGIILVLKNSKNIEEVMINALFALSNFTADPVHRKMMIELGVHDQVWRYIVSENYKVMLYTLALMRGLAVTDEGQEIFPKLGVLPIIISITRNPATPKELIPIVLDILLHFSFNRKNAYLLLEQDVIECLDKAALATESEYVPIVLCIIANLCESVELHDRIMESRYFIILQSHIFSDSTAVQQHSIRAFLHLSLSPKYHHVILATGVLSNVMSIAMTEKLHYSIRVNAVQILAAISATHPTTPTEQDVMDLVFLACNLNEDIEIRRYCMLALANAASDRTNTNSCLKKAYLEAILSVIAKDGSSNNKDPSSQLAVLGRVGDVATDSGNGADTIFVDFATQFFYNLSKCDEKTGLMLLQCGFEKKYLEREFLKRLSLTAATYFCDLCRQIADEMSCRQELTRSMFFASIIDSWDGSLLDEQELAPHLSLMFAAFLYYSDTHREFVLQGGLRILVEIYNESKNEHVRLCCLLSLLYLSDDDFAQRSISQENGIRVLLDACENESHIDLVTNSLKALIPFACNEVYRPQLGMQGALDTFSSFLFSNQVDLKQLGVFCLQNLLEYKQNREIFLGKHAEKNIEENYVEVLAQLLPTVKKGVSESMKKMSRHQKRKEESEAGQLTPHDPFITRCIIHCFALLSLEHDTEIQEKIISYNVPQLLYNLLYSEQIDKASGESILLFFAEMLHGEHEVITQLLKDPVNMDSIPLLLSFHRMGSSNEHTGFRCLSGLLSISRNREFRSRIILNLPELMNIIHVTLNRNKKTEHFYATCAILCALLAELTQADPKHHDKFVEYQLIETFLIFITTAGNGLNNQIVVDLLIAAVYGISRLASSSTQGKFFLKSLLFPPTRIQLFVSLLRLPAGDIDQAFHHGGVGMKALQRAAKPSLTSDELQSNRLDCESFLGMVDTLPSSFIYRHVLRVMAICAADREYFPHLKAAVNVHNMVPTCLFGIQGSSDAFAEIFSYSLMTRLSDDNALKPILANASPLVNLFMDYCRRFQETFTTAQLNSRYKKSLLTAQTTKVSALSLSFNKYLMSLVVVVNLVHEMKIRYNPISGDRLQKKEKDTMEKWLKKDGGEVGADQTGLSRTNAEFMTTIAGHLMGALNIDVILQFARAIRQQMEEEKEAEAAKEGQIEDREQDEKKIAEREGLVMLNEVQEYITKCTFVMCHNSMCARSDFAISEMAHRPKLPTITASDRMAGVKFDTRPTQKEKSAVFKNMDRRTLQKKKQVPGVTFKKKAEDPEEAMAKPDPATIVPDALVLAFPTMRGLQTKVGQIMKLIGRCIEMSVGLEMVELGLEMITALAYFAPFVIQDPKLVVKMIQQRMGVIQGTVCCLAANCSAHWVREVESFKDFDTSFMFPLLTGNDIMVRRNLIGFLANCAVQLDCLEFVMKSGMLRLYTNLGGRLYFIEQFSVILEMNRCLANMTTHSFEMHKFLNSEHVIAFLADTLQYSYTFLHGIFTRPADEKAKRDKKKQEMFKQRREELKMKKLQKQRALQHAPPLYESNLYFQQQDRPPLGIKLRWTDPPIFLGVIEGTPAQRYENSLIQESHALVSINGEDVKGLTQSQIVPMFQVRPLSLLFRRQDVDPGEGGADGKPLHTVEDILEEEELMPIEGEEEEEGLFDDDEEDPLVLENKRIAKGMGIDIEGDDDPDRDPQELGKFLEKITVAGEDNMKLYLECFHLCLLSLHNLSCTADCHGVILQEPKILDFFIELLSSGVIGADLRRIVFSTLCNLARQQHVAGKIFKAMSQYYLDHENIDNSLEKYILLTANLLYVNSEPHLIEPDRATFLFISKIAETHFHIPEIRVILIETLHRMSMCPVELRSRFCNREVLVILLKLLDVHEQYEVQVRAFEAAYFLTVGCVDPFLWENVELIPRMWKAAATKKKRSANKKEEDVLFEMVVRTTALITDRDCLVEQLIYIADMDNFLMDLFNDSTKGEDLLFSSSHLMSLLFKTKRHATFWSKWYAQGFLEKIAGEFQRYQNIQRRIEAELDNDFVPGVDTTEEDREQSRYKPATWTDNQKDVSGLAPEFVNKDGELHKTDFLTSLPLDKLGRGESTVQKYVAQVLGLVPINPYSKNKQAGLLDSEIPTDMTSMENHTAKSISAQWDYPVKTASGKIQPRSTSKDKAGRVPNPLADRQFPDHKSLQDAVKSVFSPNTPVGLSLVHPVAPGLDSLLHVLSYAVNHEPEVMDILRHDVFIDYFKCRLHQHCVFYQIYSEKYGTKPPEESSNEYESLDTKRDWRIKYERAVNSFRIICRLLTLVASTPYGATALGHMKMVPTLSQLLNLPFRDIRIAAARLLCAISVEKPVCIDILADKDFKDYMKILEEQVIASSSKVNPEEVECFATIFDHCCVFCVKELTKAVHENFFSFIVYLIVYSESMATMNRCMRALTQITMMLPEMVIPCLEEKQGYFLCYSMVVATLMRDGEWKFTESAEDADAYRLAVMERFRIARHRGLGVLSEKESSMPAETKLLKHLNMIFLTHVFRHASNKIWKNIFEQSNLMMMCATLRQRFLNAFSDVDKEVKRQKHLSEDDLLVDMERMSPKRAKRIKQHMLNQTACDADLLNCLMCTIQMASGLCFSQYLQYAWEPELVDGLTELRGKAMDREYVPSLIIKFLEFLYVRIFPACGGESMYFDPYDENEPPMKQIDDGNFDSLPEEASSHSANLGPGYEEFAKVGMSTRRRVAYFLSRDIRVLTYLSTFLREIATQPVANSLFNHVLRSEIYYKMCVAVNRATVQVYKLEDDLDPYSEVKQSTNQDLDSFKSTVRATGEGMSPLAVLINECSWSVVFENIVICLRANVAQSLYEGVDPKNNPLHNPLLEQPRGIEKVEHWRWQQQDKLILHYEAHIYLPEAVYKFQSRTRVLTEAIQYFALTATFQDYCKMKQRDSQGNMRSPQSEMTRLYSLLNPIFLRVLFDALSLDEHPQTQLLTVYQISQLLYYQKDQLLDEWQRVKDKYDDKDMFNVDSVMHCATEERIFSSAEREAEFYAKHTLLLDESEGIPRLLAQCFLLFSKAFEMKLENFDRSKLIYHCLQIVSNLLTLDIPGLNTIILNTETLMPLMRETFKQLYEAYDAVNSSEEYIDLLDAFIRVLRNIITIGCPHENVLHHAYERTRIGNPELTGTDGFDDRDDEIPEGEAQIWVSENEKDIMESTLKHILDSLDLFFHIEFMVGCIYKLVDSPRFIPDHSKWKTKLFDSAILTFRTMFSHHDLKTNGAPIDWTKVGKAKLEFSLITMHEHRLAEKRFKDLCIEEVTLKTLYCMVKMGFVFQGTGFPKCLQVAGYGPGNDNIEFENREIAAVILSILSSTSGKNASTGDILNNIPRFIASLRHLKDPQQVLWHFKLVAHWSKLPKVTEQVATDDGSYNFIFEGLKSHVLFRHSIMCVHNLTVLKSEAIQSRTGSVTQLCHLYKNLMAVTNPDVMWRDEALKGKSDAEILEAYALAKAIRDEQVSSEEEIHVLSRLVCASIRNVVYIHIVKSMLPVDEIAPEDRQAIYHMSTCVCKEDICLYMSMLFVLIRDKNVAFEMLKYEKTFQMILDCMVFPWLHVKPNTELPATGKRTMKSGNLTRDQLYEMEVQHMQGPIGGDDSPTRGLPSAIPKDQLGLGSKQTLYQKKRQQAAAHSMEKTGFSLQKNSNIKPSEFAFHEEYLFYMCTHIFIQCTYYPVEEAPPIIKGFESVEFKTAKARQLVHNMLNKTASDCKLVEKYFARVNDLLFVIDRSKRVLTDLYLECVSEFILHCLTIPCFEVFYQEPRIAEQLSEVAPFLLAWASRSIQNKAALICIRAKLHRQNAVCQNMAQKYLQFPELSCGLLTYALVDPEAHYLHDQYIDFINVFRQMLQQNLLSPLNINRVAIATTVLVSTLTEEDFRDREIEEADETSTEAAMSADIPEEECEEEEEEEEADPGGDGDGNATARDDQNEGDVSTEEKDKEEVEEKKKPEEKKKTYHQIIEQQLTGSKLLRSTLLQKEFQIWGGFLEELAERGHITVIKKTMSLLVSSTCGNGNYKNFPRLDDFILGLLTYVEDLLKFDFDLIFPVIVDFAFVGGKRVQMVMFSKKVHLSALRRLEGMLDEMLTCTNIDTMNTLMFRCRWIFYLFSIFLTDREAQIEVRDPEIRKDATFDAFARHDLLPIVIRYLKERHNEMTPIDTHFAVFFLALYGNSQFIQNSHILEEIFRFCQATLDEDVVANQHTAFKMMTKSEAKLVRLMGPSITELKNNVFLNVVYIVVEQVKMKQATVMFLPAIRFVQKWRERNARFIEVNVTMRPVAQYGNKKKKKKAKDPDALLTATEKYNKYQGMGRYRSLLVMFYCYKNVDKENHGVLIDDFHTHVTLCNVFEDFYGMTISNNAQLPKELPKGATIQPGMKSVEDKKAEEIATKGHIEGQSSTESDATLNKDKIIPSDEEPDPVSSQAPSKTVPNQYSFDQRLIWIRTVSFLLEHNTRKMMESAPRLLDYTLSMGYELLEEYKFSSPALVVAIECLNIVLPGMASIFEFKAFQRLRKKYVVLCVLYICSAINLPLRVKACKSLEQILEGKVRSYDETCQVLIQCDINKVWKGILRGTKEELIIATVKLMLNFVEKGQHRSRMYLLNGSMLPEVVSAMMQPTASQTRVLLLARLFSAVTTDMDFDLLTKLIATTPDIKPFLGLARSSHENRRDIVQKWIEFYGNSVVNLQGIYDAFADYGTLNGFVYMGVCCTTKDAPHFRRMLLHIVIKYYQNLRNLDSLGLVDYVHEFLVENVLEMCHKDGKDLIEAGVRFMHDFLLEDPYNQTPVLMTRIWQAKKLNYLIKFLYHKSVDQHRFAPETQHKRSKDDWPHDQIIYIQAMVLQIMERIVYISDTEDRIALVKDTDFCEAIYTWLYYLCNLPSPAVEGYEKLYESILCCILVFFKNMVQDAYAAGPKDEACSKLISFACKNRILELCFLALLPTPVEQQELLDILQGSTQEVSTDKKADHSFRKPCPEGWVKRDTESGVCEKLASIALQALLQVPDGREYFTSSSTAPTAKVMFAQINHWRNTIFEKVGSIALPAEMSFEERFVTFYLCALSRYNTDWFLENLGLHWMDRIFDMLCLIWENHPNTVLAHHSHRVCASFLQVQPLWANLVADPSKADTIYRAISRSLASPDIREYRHLLRTVAANLAFVFGYDVLPAQSHWTIKKLLETQPENVRFKQGIEWYAVNLHANRQAGRTIFTPDMMSQVVKRSNSDPDVFSRTLCVWICVVMFSNVGNSFGLAAGEEEGDKNDNTDDVKDALKDSKAHLQSFLQLEKLNVEQMVRRAALIRQQGEDENGIKLTVDLENEPSPPKCDMHWLRFSDSLCSILAKITCDVINQSWDISIRVGGLSASLAIMEAPEYYLIHLSNHFNITPVMRALLLPYPRVHLAQLTLIAILVSLKLPMNSNTIQEVFLQKFFKHQENLLIGISNFSSNGVIPDPGQPFAKDGSDAISANLGYGLIFRWFNFTHELEFGRSIRSLAAYILGQCVMPPRKNPPNIASAGEHAAMGVKEMSKAFGGKSLDDILDEQDEAKKSKHEYELVAACQDPTVELSELITDEIAREDKRLMKARDPVDQAGPQYSTYLCNLAYALAFCVNTHQKAASQSNKIRGAALFQLMKIQNILSQKTRPKELLDPTDTVDMKLFLYVRATSVVRSALQCVLNSWLATGFSSKVALSSEQGGYDLLTYCTKHIIQAFNNRTAMTKVLGSPWERIMISQGPTPTIVDLYLKICGQDANLLAVNRIGGHKALHSLSRYGDNTDIRQQATMLLTKLAVLLSEKSAAIGTNVV